MNLKKLFFPFCAVVTSFTTGSVLLELLQPTATALTAATFMILLMGSVAACIVSAKELT